MAAASAVISYHFVISAHGIYYEPGTYYEIPINTRIHTIMPGSTLYCDTRLQTYVCNRDFIPSIAPEFSHHWNGPKAGSARIWKNNINFDVKLTPDPDGEFLSGMVLCPSLVIQRIDRETSLRDLVTMAHNYVKSIHTDNNNYLIDISLLSCLEYEGGRSKGEVHMNRGKPIVIPYRPEATGVHPSATSHWVRPAATGGGSAQVNGSAGMSSSSRTNSGNNNNIYMLHSKEPFRMQTKKRRTHIKRRKTKTRRAN